MWPIPDYVRYQLLIAPSPGYAHEAGENDVNWMESTAK